MQLLARVMLKDLDDCVCLRLLMASAGLDLEVSMFRRMLAGEETT